MQGWMLGAPVPCDAEGYRRNDCSTLAPDEIGDSLSVSLYTVPEIARTVQVRNPCFDTPFCLPFFHLKTQTGSGQMQREKRAFLTGIQSHGGKRSRSQQEQGRPVHLPRLWLPARCSVPLRRIEPLLRDLVWKRTPLWRRFYNLK